MNRPKKSYLNKHLFIKTKRPSIKTRKGTIVYIDYIETSSHNLSDTSNRYEVSPQILCVKIGDEIAKRFEGSRINRQLNEMDIFTETIHILIDENLIEIEIALKLITEELSCFLKVFFPHQ